MGQLLVRDLAGRGLFYIDGDLKSLGDVARDDSGKIIAARASEDSHVVKMAKSASRWMNRERKVLMDLGISDILTPETEAEYGIPVTDAIADIVSAVKYVKHVQGVWYPEDAGQAIQPVVANASGDGQVGEMNSHWTPTTFYTVGYALAAKLPRQLVANADWDIKARALRRLVEGLRLNREIRVANLLTLSTSYAAANRIAAAAKWNAGANNNPLYDLFKALLASYIPANTLVLSEAVEPYFYAGPSGTSPTSVRDYVQAGGKLPNVVIGRAKKSSGSSGITPAYVWGSLGTTVNTPLVRVATPDTIATSMTFRWLGETADGETQDGMLVRTFKDKNDDATWIIVAHSDTEVIVSSLVGSLITGSLA
jgi:hypothetical protein